MKKVQDVRAEICEFDNMPEGFGLKDTRVGMDGRSAMGLAFAGDTGVVATEWREVESKLLGSTFDEGDKKIGITTSPKQGYSVTSPKQD